MTRRTRRGRRPAPLPDLAFSVAQEEGVVFSNESSSTIVVVATLTVAVVGALFALAHALHGFQVFW